MGPAAVPAPREPDPPATTRPRRLHGNAPESWSGAPRRRWPTAAQARQGSGSLRARLQSGPADPRCAGSSAEPLTLCLPLGTQRAGDHRLQADPCHSKFPATMQASQPPSLTASPNRDPHPGNHVDQRSNVITLGRAHVWSERPSLPATSPGQAGSNPDAHGDERPDGAAPASTPNEPAWWQAFVAPNGVRFTRTPDRIAREGHDDGAKGSVTDPDGETPITRHVAVSSELALSRPRGGSQPDGGQATEDAWSSLGPPEACEGEQTAELRTDAGSPSADPVCSEGSIPCEGASSDERASPAAIRPMELEPADEGQAEQSQKLRCDLEADLPAAGSLVPKSERSTMLATGTPVPPSFWHQGQYRVQQSAGMGSLVLLITASEQTDDRAVEEPEAAVQRAPLQLDQSEPDNIDVGYLFLYDDGLSGSSTLGAKAPKGKAPASILAQGPAPEPWDEEKGTAPGQEAEAGLACSLVCDQPPTQSAEAAPLARPGSSEGPCASRSLRAHALGYELPSLEYLPSLRNPKIRFRPRTFLRRRPASSRR
jgi:hypothetical protein